MTQSQEQEFNVLGCKVKVQPSLNDNDNNAKAVVDLVLKEVSELKMKRPMLRDTDVAVLVALKIATEKLEIENEYKATVLKLEESLENALEASGPQVV